MNEDKATRYHRLGRRAAILSAVWGMLILSGLLFSGASAVIRDGALALPAAPPSPSSLYVLVFNPVRRVDAPFSLYRGFFLERRTGWRPRRSATG